MEADVQVHGSFDESRWKFPSGSFHVTIQDKLRPTSVEASMHFYMQARLSPTSIPFQYKLPVFPLGF